MEKYCYYKVEFLEKALLGRKIKDASSTDIISKCIKLAYKDMMTVGRFYAKSGFLNTRNDICEKTKQLIENNNFRFSRELINDVSLLFNKDKKIRTETKYVTSYGLAQKFVNMTFKYFYVFSDYISKSNIDLDFTKCDCPLDSIILSNAYIKNNIKDKKCVWSKLTEEQYFECQKLISNILDLKNEEIDEELKSLGNLAFDFLNW